MHRALRWASFGTGVAALIVAAIFLLRLPAARDLWPWSGGYNNLSGLSNLFIASIAAAVAFPALWVALSGEVAAAVPGALDLVVMFGGSAIFAAQGYAATGRQTLVTAAIVFGLSVLLALIIAVYARRMPYRDRRPVPRLVRGSFLLFTIALILTGGALILKTPNIMPWTLPVPASVVYGWIFLGAAVYFTYGFFQPNWGAAYGQLIGFLAYDLVLIVPFVQHFQRVQPAQRLSLTVYVIVLIFSGSLAVYYLFLNPATRLWSRGRAQADLEVAMQG